MVGVLDRTRTLLRTPTPSPYVDLGDVISHTLGTVTTDRSKCNRTRVFVNTDTSNVNGHVSPTGKSNILLIFEKPWDSFPNDPETIPNILWVSLVVDHDRSPVSPSQEPWYNRVPSKTTTRKRLLDSRRSRDGVSERRIKLKKLKGG